MNAVARNIDVLHCLCSGRFIGLCIDCGETSSLCSPTMNGVTALTFIRASYIYLNLVDEWL